VGEEVTTSLTTIEEIRKDSILKMNEGIAKFTNVILQSKTQCPPE